MAGDFGWALRGGVRHPPFDDPKLGRRPVICDHKLYFVPCDSEDEAAFLAGLLNAPLVAGAIGAYAAQVSLGASVVEYLNIPAYDPGDLRQVPIVDLAKAVTQGTVPLDDDVYKRLNKLAAELLDVRASGR